MTESTAIATSTNLLSLLSTADGQALCELGPRVGVKKGGIVFRAGTKADSIYLLARGRVKIFQISSGGKETLLWFCSDGELFGLSELCQGDSRRVYAQACETCEVVIIPREEFKRFMFSHPGIALTLIDLLSQRLRSLGRVVEGLVTSDVPHRVAMLLRELAQRYGTSSTDGTSLAITITHQEMANMIGTTRQSVTSALSQLRRDGLVQFKNRHLYLTAAFFTPARPAKGGGTDDEHRIVVN